MEWFGDHTLRTVVAGSAALGLLSGILGSYAMLRKRSLMGDAISHAALPGLCLAFLLTGTKSMTGLLTGALVSGWLAMGVMSLIVRTTKLKEDTALGIVLSVFFGFGLVLLTAIQKMPNAAQSGLDKFLFGQAAALLRGDVIVLWVAAGAGLVFILALWKELEVFCFDPDYAHSLGFHATALDALITTAIVVAIIVGLQAVGVVLMSALIVAPAAAARQWTRKLPVMVALAGAFGLLAGVAGTLISSLGARIPTGPSIVLFIGAITAFSLMAAPERGLVWRWLQRRANHRRLRLTTVLLDLRELSLQHPPGRDPGHSYRTLRMMAGRHGTRASLRVLAERGWAQQVDAERWRLTEPGQQAARTAQHELGLHGG